MKKALALALAGMMVLSLAGCGSSASTADTAAEETSAVEETSTEESTEAESTEETAEAAEISTLTDGVLVAGTNAEFPPFEYVGDDGEPDGFDVALIKAIGEKLGLEVQMENMTFDSLISSIGTKIDVAIAGMTVTDERKETVDFSDSYYDAVQYVLVATDSDIATKDDLKNKKIGVQLGTTGDFMAEEIEGAEVSTYDKAVDGVNDLVNGRLDAVIIDKNPAEVFAGKFADSIKAIDGADFEFDVEQYAIAMKKGNTGLQEAINNALAEMKEDGTFDALVDQYINSSDDGSSADSDAAAAETADEEAADDSVETVVAE